MIEIFDKLKNYKLNGNHVVIMYKLYKEEEIEKYVLEYKIPLVELRYLVRKGLVNIPQINTTINLKSVTLTELGVQTIEQLMLETTDAKIPSKAIEEKVPIERLELEEWIEEWRDMFSSKKVGAGGNKQGVYKKMQTFLKENPTITKDEIFSATDMYFQSLDNTKYMQQADYFIYKGTGKDISSRLSQWVEVVKKSGANASDWYEQI